MNKNTHKVQINCRNSGVKHRVISFMCSQRSPSLPFFQFLMSHFFVFWKGQLAFTFSFSTLPSFYSPPTFFFFFFVKFCILLHCSVATYLFMVKMGKYVFTYFIQYSMKLVCVMVVFWTYFFFRKHALFRDFLLPSSIPLLFSILLYHEKLIILIKHSSFCKDFAEIYANVVATFFTRYISYS